MSNEYSKSITNLNKSRGILWFIESKVTKLNCADSPSFGSQSQLISLFA